MKTLEERNRKQKLIRNLYMEEMQKIKKYRIQKNNEKLDRGISQEYSSSFKLATR